MALSLAVDNSAEQMAAAPPQSTADDLARRRRWFMAYEQNKERELTEMRLHRRYYHAKQWTDDELRVFKARKQPVITDNRIGRKIDFLVGVEQRMRRDPKAFPRTPKHQAGADLATASIRFVCDQNRWETKASDATHDGMVSGIGIVWVGVEPGGTGRPDVKIKPVSVDRFFYDPRSEAPDFSDARYMGLHLWLDIDEAKDRFPQKAEEMEKMLDRTTGYRGNMTVDQDREQQWADFEGRRIRLIEFWERRVVPPYQMPVWQFSVFSGEIELDGGISPFLDEYGMPDCPYVAWTPYVDERGDRYSPIRNMRSMQDEINHRRSKFLHMINVRQLHTRTGDVEDVDAFRKELARPDGVLEHNGEWGKTTGIVDTSQEVRGQAELLAQAQAALENLGPNPGLIGKGGGVADQSGRAILAQRDSGMTELSPVFERNRDWKLRVYRKIWARIKSSWTGERWIRVTDDDGLAEFIGVNQVEVDPMSGQLIAQNMIGEIDVDIILDEGPDTITMQEELMQTFSQLGEAAAGPLGKVLIELSNVPNKDRLLKMIDDATAPDPAIGELNKKMGKLEAALKSAQIDQTRTAAQLNEARSVKELVSVGIMPQVGAGPIMIDDVPPYGANENALMQPPGADMMQPGGPDMAPPMGGVPMPDEGLPGGLPIDPNLGNVLPPA